MLEISYYRTVDGQQFTDKDKAIKHNYDIIDMSNPSFGKIYWIDYDETDISNCTVKHILPFDKPTPESIYWKSFNYYLYIRDYEALQALKSLKPYLVRKDLIVVDNSKLDVGLNYLREDGDDYDELANVNSQLIELYEDLNEIQNKINHLKSMKNLVTELTMIEETN